MYQVDSMDPKETDRSNGNWKILAILASVAMMVMFIEIMLVPALPYVAVDFHDTQWISWVLSIYLLVGAVATPLAGRLGDMYGKKKINALRHVHLRRGAAGQRVLAGHIAGLAGATVDLRA